MRVTIVVLFICFSLSVNAGELKDVIPNLENSKSVVSNYDFVLEYFDQLTVVHTEQGLTKIQKYELARHLLDVHYLCQALYHQGYPLKLEHPVIKLTLYNFPELNEFRVEGGHIFTDAIGQYFEKNTKAWSLIGS